MTDDFDAQRTFRSLPCRREDRAHRGNGDEHEDQGRRERPADLERRMTVHRLGLGCAGAGAIARNRDQEQRLDDHEDTDRPPEDVREEPGELRAEIGSRSEHRLRELPAARGEKEQEEGEY